MITPNETESTTDEIPVVNGRQYPLWSQFVAKQSEWVGDTLQDFGDALDRAITGLDSMTTKITGITLEPNGKDSAYFSVCGTDFTCGFDVEYGGIVGGEEGWLTFHGYGGHKWRIKKP